MRVGSSVRKFTAPPTPPKPPPPVSAPTPVARSDATVCSVPAPPPRIGAPPTVDTVFAELRSEMVSVPLCRSWSTEMPPILLSASARFSETRRIGLPSSTSTLVMVTGRARTRPISVSPDGGGDAPGRGAAAYRVERDRDDLAPSGEHLDVVDVDGRVARQHDAQRVEPGIDVGEANDAVVAA